MKTDLISNGKTAINIKIIQSSIRIKIIPVAHFDKFFFLNEYWIRWKRKEIQAFWIYRSLKTRALCIHFGMKRSYACFCKSIEIEGERGRERTYNNISKTKINRKRFIKTKTNNICSMLNGMVQAEKRIHKD